MKRAYDCVSLFRAFRRAATTSLLILRNWRGQEQSARRQQLSADMLLRFAHSCGLQRFDSRTVS